MDIKVAICEPKEDTINKTLADLKSKAQKAQKRFSVVSIQLADKNCLIVYRFK